ncbi:MAG: SUMF1/EgtB/PvdO family nonheme iron enzyme [Planctomycetes bacterium]|nr:SUMF1/EgtB/PvdO family nonheme iron enzyme [Planctomycetota bacterium]
MALGFGACDEPAATPGRSGRLGSLRDLVLYERPGNGPAASLFVDRFEVTRGDWAEFAATPRGRAVSAQEVPVAGASLPVGLVDLRQARAFAAWRFLRLPRLDEWRFASVGDGSSIYPWGDRIDIARANTGELGLGQPTPVGTFESGRRAVGDPPYDLIGNVSEWTETVAPEWWRDSVDPTQPSSGSAAARDRVLRSPALAAWQYAPGLVPPAWVAAAGGAGVVRYVVGSDFQSHMQNGVEPVPTGDRRMRTGFRLYTTPAELLQALCADPMELQPADVAQVRQFVRRGNHREVLVAAWAQCLGSVQGLPSGTPLAEQLQLELFGSSPAGR